MCPECGHELVQRKSLLWHNLHRLQQLPKCRYIKKEPKKKKSDEETTDKKKAAPKKTAKKVVKKTVKKKATEVEAE